MSGLLGVVLGRLGGRLSAWLLGISAAFATLAILVLRIFRAGRDAGERAAAARTAARRQHNLKEKTDVDQTIDRLGDDTRRERLRERWTRR